MGPEKQKECCGDYEIVQSVEIGEVRIVLGRNDSLSEPYLVGNHRTRMEGLFSEYRNCAVSSDYMSILGEYLSRQQIAYETVMQQREERHSDTTPFDVNDCLPGVENQVLVDQVVALSAKALSPEYRTKDNQLLYVLGGNGAYPNSRGTKVYVRDCWTGECFYVRRSDILGILSASKMPKWARENAYGFSKEVAANRQHGNELEM